MVRVGLKLPTRQSLSSWASGNQIFYDGEDDHLRRIEKAFEALAFIDGKLHKTTPLPSYMVTVGNKTEVSLDNEAGRHMNWRTAYRGLNFNADQFDTAVKLAAEIASVTPGDKRPGVEATGDWEILVEAALTSLRQTIAEAIDQ